VHWARIERASALVEAESLADASHPERKEEKRWHLKTEAIKCHKKLPARQRYGRGSTQSGSRISDDYFVLLITVCTDATFCQIELYKM